VSSARLHPPHLGAMNRVVDVFLVCRRLERRIDLGPIHPQAPVPCLLCRAADDAGTCRSDTCIEATPSDLLHVFPFVASLRDMLTRRSMLRNPYPVLSHFHCMSST